MIEGSGSILLTNGSGSGYRRPNTCGSGSATLLFSYALQRKGRWESNINVWFPFMYSQKLNCYYLNRIIMFCLSVPLLIYLWEIHIGISWTGLPILLQGNMWTDPGNINRSQTHECGNWDWGRAIPRKGIHKWDFPCSVVAGSNFSLLILQTTWLSSI